MIVFSILVKIQKTMNDGLWKEHPGKRKRGHRPTD